MNNLEIILLQVFIKKKSGRKDKIANNLPTTLQYKKKNENNNVRCLDRRLARLDDRRGGGGNWGLWRVSNLVAVGDVTYARVFTLLH